MAILGDFRSRCAFIFSILVLFRSRGAAKNEAPGALSRLRSAAPTDISF